jgi:hypothetical protein
MVFFFSNGYCSSILSDLCGGEWWHVKYASARFASRETIAVFLQKTAKKLFLKSRKILPDNDLQRKIVLLYCS